MILDAQQIYLVGIKGIAMSGLASMLKSMGKDVTGSDITQGSPTDEVLENCGISTVMGFDSHHITETIDLVITTAAHDGLSNSEVKEATRRGIKVITYAQALGEVCDLFKTSIVVAGSHGKTTTSSLLAFMLDKLNLSPSYLVGTSGFQEYPGAALKGMDYLVLEGDEYVASYPDDKTPKLFFLHPSISIITNIDYDHPDVYSDIHDVIRVFKTYIDSILENQGTIIACRDDEHVYTLVKGRMNVITYGFSPDADYHIRNIEYRDDKTTFEIIKNGENLGKFTIALAGEKNILNTTAVIALTSFLKLSISAVRDSLPLFTGPKRRFEQLYKGSIIFYDDYGHHPAEIKATIQAAKKRYPNKRIVIVFQPHTFSRTESLADDFIDALSQADLSFITDIFPAGREKAKDFLISSESIASSAVGKNYNNIKYVPFNTIISVLNETLHDGDILFSMGAGELYKTHPDIINLLKAREKNG